MSTEFIKYAALLGAISLAACGDAGGPHRGEAATFDALGELASAKGFTRYVALGDSFVSGDGNWDSWDLSCRRSANSYPELLKRELAKTGTAPKTTVAGCSGGTIDTVTASQLSSLPAGSANSLITVTVGGNDLKISTELAGCILKTASCSGRRSELTALIETTAPKLQTLFAAIKTKSPGSRIVATGYPMLVTANAHTVAGCSSLDAEEVKMIRELINLMNTKIAAAASAEGIMYVDLERVFAGHEACSLSNGTRVSVEGNTRWINGGDGLKDVGTSLLHPNRDGNKAIALAIKRALDQSGVPTVVSRVVDTPVNPLNPTAPQLPVTPQVPTAGTPSAGLPAAGTPAAGTPAAGTPAINPVTGKPLSSAPVQPRPATPTGAAPVARNPALGGTAGGGAANPLGEGSNDPLGEDATDPLDEDATDPLDEDATDPLDEDATDPLDEDAADPLDEDATDPLDEDATDPFDEDATDPLDEGATDPLDEEAADPVDEEAADPVDEESADLSGETYEGEGEASEDTYEEEGYSDGYTEEETYEETESAGYDEGYAEEAEY